MCIVMDVKQFLGLLIIFANKNITCKISKRKSVTSKKDGAHMNLSIRIFLSTIPKSEFVAFVAPAK